MKCSLTSVAITCLVLATAQVVAGQLLSRDPVFLVHGHGLSSRSWTSIMAYLEGQGYPAEFLRAIDLVPRGGLNQPAAELQIAPAIETFLNEVNTFLNSQGYPGSPKTRVDIVSHSMGGMSSRWYTGIVAPERVDTWVSIAGANHGTDDLCPYTTNAPSGADDSCPAYSTDTEDIVQLTLNGLPHVPDVDETPYGMGADWPGVTVVFPEPTRRILYATIRTEPDPWISPDDSAVIDGAGGIPVSLPGSFPAVETSPGNYLMTYTVGHSDMTSNPDVMQLVALFLSLEIGPYCGDGVVDPTRGEQCDDGNRVNGDCCDSVCQFEFSGSPCDDGNPCTNESCATGECVAQFAVDCDGLGDTDCDGQVNSSDALLNLCLFAGLCAGSDLPAPCNDPSHRLKVADWDRSGQIDSSDALTTLGVFVRLVSPCDTPLGACCC